MTDLGCNLFLISLGANLAPTTSGNWTVLSDALGQMQAHAQVVAVSRFWQTPAYPAGSGPDFVNACASTMSKLGPEAFLAMLHDIEARLGRTRDKRWGPRSVDLDLLAQGARIHPDSETLRHWMHLPPDRQRRDAPGSLILPHPRLQDRAFVLLPLAEIAPDWRHPVLGLTIAEMAASLDPQVYASYRPL